MFPPYRIEARWSRSYAWKDTQGGHCGKSDVAKFGDGNQVE